MNSQPLSRLIAVLVILSSIACSRQDEEPSVVSAPAKPSILLVTLDTTRADSLGFESDEVETPALEALAARGMRFEQALTTAPMTLPSHTSMLTGLYPAEHGIHENSRYLAEDRVVLAERLDAAGYTTAAFISGYPLKRRFGLARGFHHYDDDLGAGNTERLAAATTDRVLSYLSSSGTSPLFLWVHYFDPHEPYAPPEPFRSRYPASAYLAEVASMDQEVGRLVEAFDEHCADRPSRILVVGDHGEGLGDHGERLHGSLLYQGVIRVPLILVGSGIPSAVASTPVSTRRVYDTLLNWAGVESGFDLVMATPEIVMAEALEPHLQYGWQPQVMAVDGTIKVIRSGDTEIFDLASDRAESVNLRGRVTITPEVQHAVNEYLKSTFSRSAGQAVLDEETKRQLASLGYVGGGSAPRLRPDAPNPRDMVHLLDDLDDASRAFVREDYAKAAEILERVLIEDDGNLMVTVRLAVSHSFLGHETRAVALFKRATQIQPDSLDLQHYLAMHYFRTGRWDLAGPLFEKVLDAMPHRLPSLEALARIREGQDRLEEAARLVERSIALKERPVAEWLRLGQLEMATGRTTAAIRAFEHAEQLQGDEFRHHLELGALYLAAGLLPEAASSLDRVSHDHPGYGVALFKRAQAAVLLGDPGWREHVRRAAEYPDPAVRRMVEREPLFRDAQRP